MQFGQAPPKELGKIDFTLPQDPAPTKKVLANAKKNKCEILVGCAKWGRPDWVGKIYPKGTKAANFLDAYAQQFNCIEFNAIFYKLPDKKEVHAWKAKVGKDFKFFPKFTEVITHRKRLKNTRAEVDAFLEVVHEFGNNLGPLFLMPHPQMGPKHLDTILEFLDSLPKDVKCFTELRHTEWYQDNNAEKLFAELEKRGRGTIITDAAGRRDCVHMRLTTPEAFIRFVGNSLHESDYRRIDEWVDRIGQWMKQGLQKCYFFMHQHEELYSPELCKYLIEQMNKKLGTQIKVPQFVGDISGAGVAKTKLVARKKSTAKKSVTRPVGKDKKTDAKKPAKKPLKKAAVKKTAKKN